MAIAETLDLAMLAKEALQVAKEAMKPATLASFQNKKDYREFLRCAADAKQAAIEAAVRAAVFEARVLPDVADQAERVAREAAYVAFCCDEFSASNSYMSMYMQQIKQYHPTRPPIAIMDYRLFEKVTLAFDDRVPEGDLSRLRTAFQRSTLARSMVSMVSAIPDEFRRQLRGLSLHKLGWARSLVVEFGNDANQRTLSLLDNERQRRICVAKMGHAIPMDARPLSLQGVEKVAREAAWQAVSAEATFDQIINQQIEGRHHLQIYAVAYTNALPGGLRMFKISSQFQGLFACLTDDRMCSVKNTFLISGDPRCCADHLIGLAKCVVSEKKMDVWYTFLDMLKRQLVCVNDKLLLQLPKEFDDACTRNLHIDFTLLDSTNSVTAVRAILQEEIDRRHFKQRYRVARVDAFLEHTAKLPRALQTLVADFGSTSFALERRHAAILIASQQQTQPKEKQNDDKRASKQTIQSQP